MSYFSVAAQSDTTKTEEETKRPFLEWIGKHVNIAQSLETTQEDMEEPAQFQFTFPKNETPSYLINLGVAADLAFLSKGSLLSKAKVEYHKNTLIDEKQNSLEVGYQGTLNFRDRGQKTVFFTTFDPKYVYNGEEKENSFASNLLFSWTTINSKLNWNTNNYYNNKKQFFFIGIFGGFQFQDIFQAEADDGEGFILRPTYSAISAFGFNKEGKKDKPIIRLSASYTGRYDWVNETNVKEGYTQLFKTGIDWYLVNDPIKVSLGTSFNYGSDPLRGLAQQQFWLFTINVSK
ncbi:hypothetical protein [Flavobacterium sp.]|uniref:hypothetical protein n=1 Tax=Flavobacterium sp. TaxID=239 RepID=UPI00404707CD